MGKTTLIYRENGPNPVDPDVKSREGMSMPGKKVSSGSMKKSIAFVKRSTRKTARKRVMLTVAPIRVGEYRRR